MVEMLKFGFSLFRKSHAAFSANVLAPRYPNIGSTDASASVMGFQSCSEYSCPARPRGPSMIAAKEEVIICSSVDSVSVRPEMEHESLRATYDSLHVGCILLDGLEYVDCS